MMILLYANPKSGNCYKVAWILNILQIPFKTIQTSFVDGGTKHPDFLAKNPNAQVPLLEFPDGRLLAESNAIMLYLAEQAVTTKSSVTLLPQDDPFERALVYQWMFFEQYSHEPAIAVRRANLLFDRPCSDYRMQELLNKGYKALDVMEMQLSKTSYIVGDKMTIADISLFAYTHNANEGQYQLDRYPNIQSWLKRIMKSPGFCGMDILDGK